METEALKFSVASRKDFPYRSLKFSLSNLISSQKASNIENINLENFHGPLTQICNNAQVCLCHFLLHQPCFNNWKKSMVLFILSEIVNLKNQEKTEEIENFRS